MKQRCHNPNAANYIHYGGRGIHVCDRWRNSFSNFLEDMGPSHFDGAQIDRIDNHAGYSPDNCRWVTPRDNSKNKRNSTMVDVNGEPISLVELSDSHGIKIEVLRDRIFRYGWTVEKSISTSVIRPKTYLFRGKEMTISEISREAGINRETLRLRLKRGVPVDDAVR